MSRRWPLFRSLAGYRPGFIAPDLIAGLTLAAIAIPEQMATARLGGLPPQCGFFAFIAASTAFLAFGSNRFMSVGADSTITPIVFGGLVLLAGAGSPQYLGLAAMLALMVGVIVVVAGLARMGWIADLLSVPVTMGFLAGIAIHIIVSQAPAALGITGTGGTLLQQLAAIWQAAPRANLYAVTVAAGVLALTAAAHLVSARIPGALIGMVLATWAVVGLGLEAHGVAVLGVIPGGLPHLAPPVVELSQILQMLPLALLVALVCMVQTGATSRSFPSDPGAAPDVDGDYIGLGAANLLAGLFGAFPVDASPPRTGIVAENGGRSQLTGLAAVAVVALLLVFGAGLLTHVPHAALAGVLLFVAARIVRVRQMRAVAASSPAEFLLILATAVAIVVLPIETGASIGVVLSLLYGMWSSVSPRSYRLHRVIGTTVWWPTTAIARGETLVGVCVIGFQAPLSFLNADVFRRLMLAAMQPGSGAVKLLVLEATGIIDIDFTAAQVFKGVIADARAAGVIFAVARLESYNAQVAFDRLGLRQALGENRLFNSVNDAVVALAPDATPEPAQA
ncbi:MAG TPA: SulP family inorganic anion transporter [Caulobacteraceae bacterium]